MTRFTPAELTCAGCGHTFESRLLVSTNDYGGSPDLDTRTCGMARNATLRAIQECPSCRYCSVDIEAIPAGGQNAILSPEYQDLHADSSIPVTARRWGCFAQILASTDSPDQAGWAYMSAAWSCEDSECLIAARALRMKALKEFHISTARGTEFGRSECEERAVLADIYRRCGDFAGAASVAEDALSELGPSGSEDEKLVQAVLNFQRHLSSVCDSERYSFAEAQRFQARPNRWRPRRWWEIWR